MTQEEKWRKNYKEVAEYMDTYHRNPSKHTFRCSVSTM